MLINLVITIRHTCNLPVTNIYQYPHCHVFSNRLRDLKKFITKIKDDKSLFGIPYNLSKYIATQDTAMPDGICCVQWEDLLKLSMVICAF